MNAPSPESLESNAAQASLAGLTAGILRRRRLIVVFALASGLIAGTVGLLSRRTWTSAATFMPQSRRTPAAGLTGIAAQLGITVPTTDAGQSPGFYADFLTSRTMLGALADTTFDVRRGDTTVRASLADVLEVRGKTPQLRREAVIRKLGDRVSATAVLKTGVVRVRVTAPAPDLAREMAEVILDGLNRFNLLTRQSQAGAERRFMEGRLEDARIALREAEDRLQTFLQRNRDYRNSPELTFQQDRLARDVQMRQQVYTSVAQGYEQAKIEEVRDTPVITIVEPPETPVRPDPRGVLRTSIVALFAGGMFGVLFVFMMSAVERERAAHTDDMEAVEKEMRAALVELRRPWRLLMGPRSED